MLRPPLRRSPRTAEMFELAFAHAERSTLHVFCVVCFAESTPACCVGAHAPSVVA